MVDLTALLEEIVFQKKGACGSSVAVLLGSKSRVVRETQYLLSVIQKAEVGVEEMMHSRGNN